MGVAQDGRPRFRFEVRVQDDPDRVVVVDGPKWMHARLACEEYRSHYRGLPCGACRSCKLFEFAGGEVEAPVSGGTRTVDIEAFTFRNGTPHFASYLVGRPYDDPPDEAPWDVPSIQYRDDLVALRAPVYTDANDAIWLLLGNGMVQQAGEDNTFAIDSRTISAAQTLFDEMFPHPTSSNDILQCARELKIDLAELGLKIEEAPTWFDGYDDFRWACATLASLWGVFSPGYDRQRADAFWNDLLVELLFEAYDRRKPSEAERQRMRDMLLIQPSRAKKPVSGPWSGEAFEDWIAEQFDADFLADEKHRSVSRRFIDEAKVALKREQARRKIESYGRNGGDIIDPYDEDFHWSLNLVEDGKSVCDRYVITGSDGEWSHYGDVGCTPVFARCGIAVDGSDYRFSTTYRCANHGATTIAI